MTLTINDETTDDEWLPQHCPDWCEGGHERALIEGCGWRSAQMHTRTGGGGMLSEIRNPIDRRVTRPGDGGWNLHAEQMPMPMPRGGLLTEPTVVLTIDGAGHTKIADLPLTTGEARVLARQLVALADLIDL